MYRIQTLNKISSKGLSCFPETKYAYGDQLENPDAILVRSASLHEMEFGNNLKAIARAGAGVNNIPVEACAEKGIVVFNTPGANANAVKELVLAAMLISSRKIPQAIEWVGTLKGQGDAIGKIVEKNKSRFAGPELAGKKLGVIGLGAIGVLVANAASHLGMEVYGYDPYLSVESAWHLSHSVHHAETLKEIFTECDYITVHVPLTPETKNSVDREALSMMKEGARLYNFARDGLVDNDAVLEALASGKLAAYVTDLPAEKLIGEEGVIAVPHLGASTPESEENCASMAVAELIDFFENGNIRHSVNFPEVVVPRETDCRVCVIHRNVPNMLSQISGVFSAMEHNIENMTNKSKNEYAYTVLDIRESDFRQDYTEQLKKIEGVIRVRVIRSPK